MIVVKFFGKVYNIKYDNETVLKFGSKGNLVQHSLSKFVRIAAER